MRCNRYFGRQSRFDGRIRAAIHNKTIAPMTDITILPNVPIANIPNSENSQPPSRPPTIPTRRLIQKPAPCPRTTILAIQPATKPIKRYQIKNIVITFYSTCIEVCKNSAHAFEDNKKRSDFTRNQTALIFEYQSNVAFIYGRTRTVRYHSCAAAQTAYATSNPDPSGARKSASLPRATTRARRPI